MNELNQWFLVNGWFVIMGMFIIGFAIVLWQTNHMKNKEQNRR